jgi:hypothetical protein
MKPGQQIVISNPRDGYKRAILTNLNYHNTTHQK